MHNFQVADQTASLEITINPLVNWIWLGFAVMALGTGIVLLPERTFAFAMAKFPAPEVATTAGMFLLMLCLAAPALAQHTENGARGARRGVLAGRARVAARHHLHVRHLRPKESRGVHLQQSRGHAHRALGARQGQGRRGKTSFSTTSPSTAARSRSRRRSTKGSIGWRGSFRTPSADSPPLPARSSSESGRGARTTSRRAATAGRSFGRRRRTAGAARPRARKPRLVPCLQRNRRPISYGRGNSSRSARSSARRRPSSSFAARAPKTSFSCASPFFRRRWSALRRSTRCVRSRPAKRASPRWWAVIRARRSSARRTCCCDRSRSSSSITRWERSPKAITRRWSAGCGRARCVCLQQLDNTSSGYRELIERELAARLVKAGGSTKVEPYGSAESRTLSAELGELVVEHREHDGVGRARL